MTDLITMEWVRWWQVSGKMANAMMLAGLEWWMDLSEPYYLQEKWSDE